MKRLVDLDDPDDEVVRLLIRAGASHQPSPGGKMRLIAALGVGSAVGLSASKVLAWLGTSSGKVALAVTVAGTAAGGAYVLTGAAPDASSPPAPPSVAAPAIVSAATAPSVLPEVAPLPLDTPEPALDAVSAPAVEAGEAVERATARSGRRAPPRSARATPRAPLAEPAPPPETLERRASLSDETAWVDRLRMAAEAGDRPGFERLASEYDERFPEGQLHPEVNRLRSSLR